MSGTSRLDFTADLVDRVESVELLDSGIQLTRRNERPRFVAYGDIALVRLRYTPMRGLPNFYACTIEPRSGKPMRFGSMTRMGFLRGYQPVPYTPFVRELHARLLAAGAQPQFWAGDPTGQFTLRLVGTIVMSCIMIGIVVADRRITGWAVVPMLAVTGWLIWTQVRTLRTNETRRYDPHDMPQELLPEDPA